MMASIIREETRKKILDLLEKTQGYEVKKEYALRRRWGVEDTHDETYWVEYGVTRLDRRYA
jgi:hypothetical protein